jgi:hypothetical protein
VRLKAYLELLFGASKHLLEFFVFKRHLLVRGINPIHSQEGSSSLSDYVLQVSESEEERRAWGNWRRNRLVSTDPIRAIVRGVVGTIDGVGVTGRWR